jgi:hypothetical protein
LCFSKLKTFSKNCFFVNNAVIIHGVSMFVAKLAQSYP